MQINDNIKLIRELSGKTQVEFAELIKTNVSNLKTYENTNVKPKAYLILNISKYAGVSADDLENKKLYPEDVKFNDDEKDERDGNYKKSPADPIAIYERIIEEKEARRRDAEAWAQKMEAHYNDMKNALERAQTTINEVLKPIKEQTQEILTNSKEVRENMMDGIIEMQSEHRAIMDGVDQILKQPIGTTFGKADILEEASQEIRTKDHKKKSAHKQSKAD